MDQGQCTIDIDIPGYRIIRPLGRGGMATVYLAIQESFQREVALKIMSPALSENGSFSERFLREARIVSRLVHPYIVTVHDVGIQNGHHYLSMEYIEGQDLKERLPSLNGEQIFRVLKEVAKALDYAGRKGYVHRDVKPENIMIHNLDGRAALMDFGIARAADSDSTMTRTGTALGTPHYMSPEQAKGDAIDGRSDLYSLGVLFYYMLIGRVPYEADSPVAVGIKHLSAPIPKLPEGLACYQSLINKLLAKKPEDRFQTGSELVAALEKVDVGPFERWRPKKGFEYLGSHEYTPLRSDQVALVDERGAPEDVSSVEVVEQEEIRAASFSAEPPQPREMLHIPKEDLDARLTVKKNNYGLIFLPSILLVAAAVGYYFNKEPVDAFVAQLRGASVQAPVAPAIESAVEPKAVSVVEEAPEELQVSAPVGALDSGTVATDSVVESVEASDDLAVDPVAELLQRSQLLSEQVKQQPERMPELLGLYRQILLLQPGQVEVIDALKVLKKEVLSVAAIQLDVGEMTLAKQSLDAALAWFPELEEEDSYLRILQRFNDAEKIAMLLPEAEKYLARDRLLRPAGDNAKALFDQVLALDPGNSRAKQGLKSIVQRYLFLARSSHKKGFYSKAISQVESGLTVEPANQNLVLLRDKLLKEQGREQQIEKLLLEAELLAQKQQWFGEGESAAQKYQAVLALDPNQGQASNQLASMLDGFVSEIEGLIAIRDYDLATSRVQSAIKSLPGHERLQLLLQEVESSTPLIDKLQISGTAIDDFEAQTSDKVSADRTLHIAFRFSHLEQATTVLQAVLFDGGRSVQIAGVPVVVMGEEGYTQFRIDRPVEGFTEGGYHIDILLGGQKIFSSPFIIDN